MLISWVKPKNVGENPCYSCHFVHRESRYECLPVHTTLTCERARFVASTTLSSGANTSRKSVRSLPLTWSLMDTTAIYTALQNKHIGRNLKKLKALTMLYYKQVFDCTSMIQKRDGVHVSPLPVT
jgi:hypothetical protein